MFGKLLKHEFRSGLRLFLPLWVGMLALAAVTGFGIRSIVVNVNYMMDSYSSTGNSLGVLPAVLPVILLTLLLAAMLVVTVVYIIRRFYSGLLGSEGYLMFTLPVTTDKLLSSRVLSAYIYQLCSTLAALASAVMILLIASPDSFVVFFRELFRSLTCMFREDGLWVLVFIEGILFLLLMLLEVLMRIQFSISLGHLFKKHRAGYGALMYVAISWLQQSIFTTLSFTFGMDWLEWLFEEGYATRTALTLGALLAVYAAFCVGYYFGMRSILKKKLNLE